MSRDPVLLRKVLPEFEIGKTYTVETMGMHGNWKLITSDTAGLWFRTAKNDLFVVQPSNITRAKEVREGD